MEDSTDVATRVRLAEAHRLAGRPEAARVLLDPVASTDPVAGFHLALTLEDLGQRENARAFYRTYLETGDNDELKTRVRARLAALEQRELEAAIRFAVANEVPLNGAPAPGTIGVFPFLTVTDDPELRVLGTALAELLTTDLALTGRLRVLERTQLQALLDELELAESGRVDPATAAQSGQLLSAGNIVQGRVEAASGELSTQAVVVRVPAQADEIPSPIREDDALARVFDMQKRLALGLYDRMGIQLTAAERTRITRHATQNVQALLEFGYGLEAMDAGDYLEAAQHFVNALDHDPAFDLARTHWSRSEELWRAATMDPVELVRLGLQEAGAFAEFLRFELLEAAVPDPALRNPTPEVLGVEGVNRRGTIEIVIRPPGGGQ